MTTAVEIIQESKVVACWCCGKVYPEDQVVRLGSHPEVAVCIGCARYLNRRANQQTPVNAVTRFIRGVGQGVRAAVVLRGWHEKPLIGPAVRWLDRHVPW